LHQEASEILAATNGWKEDLFEAEAKRVIQAKISLMTEKSWLLSANWTHKHGRQFKDAFRELAAVDEAFDDSSIASAERILAAEAKRTGDAFEAMGLKIPAEIAVRCGVLLILAVQLYLWLHLHEFGNRMEREAGFEVAWIGVYFSRPARFAFIGTLLVLPACTMVLPESAA
jgi:hypothetical protein